MVSIVFYLIFIPPSKVVSRYFSNYDFNIKNVLFYLTKFFLSFNFFLVKGFKNICLAAKITD